MQSQQDFIVAKKLDPALRRISDIKGLNLEYRSPVVRDVLYSTATQHGEGGAADVFIVHWDLMHQTLVMKILSIRSIKKGVMLANILEKVQLKFKTI